MANENSLVININGSAKNFLDELDKIKKKTESLESILSKTAKASAALFAGFAASIAVVTKSFIDYEKALVGVGKTTNIEGQKLKNFGKEFQKLSSEIPVATNELLGIAQAAGQLGVSGEANLLKFTETIAKLGVATDLTGEQAATSLTRILNVTGEGIETIDTFGSVIVALGNNFAATESEIVRVTTEVSRSTAVFGVSASEAAGLATALKSLGVQAQLGGSAVGRAFRTIDKTIREGGTGLENLSKLTGVAGDQLKQTFEEDSTRVFQLFLEGLGEVEKGGGSVTAALEKFGLKGDEINKVLPVLAKNSELLGSALGTAAKETLNATALNKEAETAFNTLGSEVQKVRNNLTNLATNIGAQLAPQILELLKGVNEVVKKVSEMDTEIVGVIASFLKWGAIISGAVASLATFLLGAAKVSAVITSLAATFGPAALGASAFWVALTGPVGIAVAGVAALTAGFFALRNALKDPEAPKSLEQISDELSEINKEIDELQSKGKGALRGDQLVNLKDLKDRRKELEKLAAAKKAATEDKAVLNREFEGPLAGFDKDIFGDVGPESIPLKGKAEIEKDDTAEKESLAKLKKNEDDKSKLIDEATAKRIEKLKTSNAELDAVQQAKLEGDTEEEKAFLQRKAEIQNEFAAAENIKNQEERDLALDNLTIKHADELQEITDFENKKIDDAAARREEKAALDEELNQLDKEQRALLNEEELASLQSSIDTQKEAEEKFAKEKIQKQIAERNRFKQDELKFGTEVAQVKAFFRKEEVVGVKNATANLVQLTNSRNSTLKGIGKAAARVQAAIKTAEGAISAYASLSGIPLIGPALGAAAAGAIITFGVEQQQKISSAQTGGFVPPTSGGSRDRVPMLLEPNELVVPSALAPNFIQAAGIPDNQTDQAVGDQSASGSSVIEIMLEDRAGEFISLEQREGKALGLIGA